MLQNFLRKASGARARLREGKLAQRMESVPSENARRRVRYRAFLHGFRPQEHVNKRLCYAKHCSFSSASRAYKHESKFLEVNEALVRVADGRESSVLAPNLNHFVLQPQSHPE